MSDNLKIQKATKNQSELVIDFLSKLYLELGEESESLDFLSKELIHSAIDSGITRIYLVSFNSQYVGIFTVTESQAIYAGGKYGLIDEMYISPEFRNQKFGEKIIKYIIEIARDLNWKRIDVTAPTEDTWLRTRKFYEKNGFVFTGPKYKLKL